MDFAKKHLESFGWTEGKGLGKSEDGINKAIKPKLKFDNFGVGFDQSKQLNDQWWCGSPGFIANKTKKLKVNDKESSQGSYGFVKAGESSKNEDDESSKDEDEESSKNNKIDFEKVFKKSKGRTCHKAARHGLRMNGKLTRLDMQDKEFENKTLKKS